MFIDDTGTATDMTRSHGRCARGERLRMGFPHGHRKTTTLVAGLFKPIRPSVRREYHVFGHQGRRRCVMGVSDLDPDAHERRPWNAGNMVSPKRPLKLHDN